MLALDSPIPKISISPPPLDDPPIEPYSPFNSATFVSRVSSCSHRAQHLTPPPTLSTFGRGLSPLRPMQSPPPSKGLERERFEALLEATRQRNGAVGAKKAQDLRKEIALKAHKNKQCMFSSLSATSAIVNSLWCSRTSCSLSLKGSCPSLADGHRHPEDTTRVSCHLPLLTPISWHGIPSESLRVYR
jgi:hypothetical protein